VSAAATDAKAFRDEPCETCADCVRLFGFRFSGGPDFITCRHCYDAEAEINTGRVIVAVTA